MTLEVAKNNLSSSYSVVPKNNSKCLMSPARAKYIHLIMHLPRYLQTMLAHNSLKPRSSAPYSYLKRDILQPSQPTSAKLMSQLLPWNSVTTKDHCIYWEEWANWCQIGHLKVTLLASSDSLASHHGKSHCRQFGSARNGKILLTLWQLNFWMRNLKEPISPCYLF